MAFDFFERPQTAFHAGWVEPLGVSLRAKRVESDAEFAPGKSLFARGGMACAGASVWSLVDFPFEGGPDWCFHVHIVLGSGTRSALLSVGVWWCLSHVPWPTFHGPRRPRPLPPIEAVILGVGWNLPRSFADQQRALAPVCGARQRHDDRKKSA